jgi:hypothetical protein
MTMLHSCAINVSGDLVLLRPMYHCLSAQLTSPGHWLSPRGSRAVPDCWWPQRTLRIVQCIYSKIVTCVRRIQGEDLHVLSPIAAPVEHGYSLWLSGTLSLHRPNVECCFCYISSVTECRTNLIAHLHLHVKALKPTNTLYWYSSHSTTVVTVKHWSHNRKI